MSDECRPLAEEELSALGSGKSLRGQPRAGGAHPGAETRGACVREGVQAGVGGAACGTVLSRPAGPRHLGHFLSHTLWM